MAWYDYIPGVSNVHGLLNGNVAQMAGGPVGYMLSKPGEDAASNAANAQKSALDQAMARLQEFSQQQYKNRMADLDKTMSFYGPAQRYLESIYGGAAPGTGGPVAGRAPVPVPDPTGTPPGFPKSPTAGALGSFAGPRRGY